MSDPDSGALQALRSRSTAPEMSFESPVDIVNGMVQQRPSSPNPSPAIAIRSSSPSCATIDANVPPQLDIHLIVDNYATHKHPKVRTWFARHSHHAYLYLLAQSTRTLPRPHHSIAPSAAALSFPP